MSCRLYKILLRISMSQRADPEADSQQRDHARIDFRRETGRLRGSILLSAEKHIPKRGGLLDLQAMGTYSHNEQVPIGFGPPEPNCWFLTRQM